MWPLSYCLQAVGVITQSLESLLTELATFHVSDTDTPTTTADDCTDRIERAIDCIDELIGAYGYSTHVQSFLSAG